MNKLLVWGLGKSGQAAVKLLESRGFEVFSGDDARGDRWEEFIEAVDTVVLSPGIPPHHPLWIEAERKGLEVIGELELAWRFFKGKVIAITGTDGKSTTTRLTYLMLRGKLGRVYEAGNMGTPFSEVVLRDPEATVVLEVSSFQGKTLKTFRPTIGAFLNFHEDHLDWHPDLADYLHSKYRIFSRQIERDLFIAGSDQREVVDTPTKARKLNFQEGLKLFNSSDLKLKGEHNLKNAAVAALIAHLFGASEEDIRKVLREFRGLPFRMELVLTFRGIEIYNDSKSTTPNALRAALSSFPQGSVILIAGGKDKGVDFGILTDVADRVKLALLIGETKEKLSEFFGKERSELCSSLEEAVDRALRVASPGDFILFSPGCSSFDMFTNYVERGNAFERLVRERCKL